MKKPGQEKNAATKKLLPYTPPKIVTRTDDDLLNAIGPALAGTAGENVFGSGLPPGEENPWQEPPP